MKTTEQMNYGAMRYMCYAVIIIEVGKVFCSVWSFPRELAAADGIFLHTESSYVAVNIL